MKKHKMKRNYIYIHQMLETRDDCVVCGSKLISSVIPLSENEEKFCNRCHIYYVDKKYEPLDEYRFVSQKGLFKMRNTYLKINKVPGTVNATRTENIEEKNKGKNGYCHKCGVEEYKDGLCWECWKEEKNA